VAARSPLAARRVPLPTPTHCTLVVFASPPTGDAGDAPVLEDEPRDEMRSVEQPEPNVNDEPMPSRG